MKRNSQLSLALHSLGHMAAVPDRLQTSADIAAHAGTNAVVVRRVLGKLRDAGLLKSEKGHAGGWRLARTPDQITLADIYLALGERLIAGRDEDAVAECSMERALHRKVASVMAEIEKTLIERLAATTLSEIRNADHKRHEH